MANKTVTPSKIGLTLIPKTVFIPPQYNAAVSTTTIAMSTAALTASVVLSGAQVEFPSAVTLTASVHAPTVVIVNSISTDNLATIANGQDIDANDMTWSFRFKCNSIPDLPYVLISDGDSDGSEGYLWYILINGNINNPSIYLFYTSGTYQTLIIGSTIEALAPRLLDGNWHEIEIRGQNLQSFSRPPFVGQVWIDGVAQTTQTGSAGGSLYPRPASTTLTIFYTTTHTNDICIDELMIWKSALSDRQIVILQAATIDPTAGLSPDYHWTFDERDSGTIYHDTGLSGTPHNAVDSVPTYKSYVPGVFNGAFHSLPTGQPSGELKPETLPMYMNVSLVDIKILPPIRLEAFIYSSKIGYLIELGEKYMRFFYKGVILTTDGLAPHADHSTDYWISTPYLGADIFDLQFKQVGDVMWITHASYPQAKLTRTTANTFSLEEIATSATSPFTGGPFLTRNDLIDTNQNDTALMVCSVTDVGDTGTLTCESNYILTVTGAPTPNPFVEGATLTGGSSGNTCIVLIAKSSTEYVISEPTSDFTSSETLSDGVNSATLSAVSENVIPFFQPGHVGAVFQLTHPKGTLNVNGSISTTGYIGSSLGEPLIGDYTFKFLSGSGTVVLQKSNNGFSTHTDVKTLSSHSTYKGTEPSDGYFYRINVTVHTIGTIKASLVANTNSVSGKMTTTHTGIIKYPINIKGSWRFSTSGNWDGTFVIERNENGAGWEPWRTTVSVIASGSGQGSANVQEANVENNDNVQYRMNLPIHNSGTITATIESEENVGLGIVQVTSLTSDTPPLANIVVLTELQSTDPTRRWAEGCWSGVQGYPSSVANFEGRCIYAGMSKIPIQITSSYDSSDNNYTPKELRYWLSASNDFENFEAGVGDSDSFSQVVQSTEDIAWINGTDALLLETYADTWKIQTNKLEGPLTPTTTSPKYQFGCGGCQVAPVEAEDNLIYTDGQSVRSIIYMGESEKYDTSNLIELAEHLTRDRKIVDMALQVRPDQILWCVMNDGSLAILVYDRKEKVTAWARMPMSHNVKSVAVLNGEYEDEVYISTQSLVNGAPKNYIERFGARDYGVNIEDAYFVDCGATIITDATANLKGLDFLAGETVSILADGVVQPDRVVGTDGTVTLDTPARTIHIGIPFTSTVQPMRIVTHTKIRNTSQGFLTRISKMVLSFLDSFGAKYGETTGTMYDIPFGREDVENSSRISGLVSGDIEVTMPTSFLSQNPIAITTDVPLPCTVRSMIPVIEGEEE